MRRGASAEVQNNLVDITPSPSFRRIVSLEGNVLSPKLVGDSVGLHPVWLIFALLAFGSLFGFTGLITAVPFAAAAGWSCGLRSSATAKAIFIRTRPDLTRKFFSNRP